MLSLPLVLSARLTSLRKQCLITLVLLLTISQLTFAQAPHPFVLVMIDSATEQKLGGFPLDRAVVAQAVEKLADANAKAVVLKFFYDQPAKNAASDVALAKAMTRTKVLLQARIDDNEPMPNKLPEKFSFNAPAGEVAIGGLSGWIPLPMFSALAHHIGFADVVSFDKVPAYERYLDRNVKSLTVATLQAALDDAPLVLRPAQEVTIGDKHLPVDQTNQIVLSPSALRQTEKTNIISFLDLVDGKVSAATFKGKVVVIAYDGAKMNPVKTSAGEIKPHRIFWLGLLDSWAQLR